MNSGKTLLSQLMDLLPWTTFSRIVNRYQGDHRVRTLPCAEQLRVMACAVKLGGQRPVSASRPPLAAMYAVSPARAIGPRRSR